MLGALGCDDDGRVAAGGAGGEDGCVSKSYWLLDDGAGNPNMNPGEPCMACHALGPGPAFVFAGTVYAAIDEPNDCNGVAGVVVEIEDANGQQLSAISNEAGNFFLEQGAVTLPITATLSYQGATRVMPRFVHATDCNSCHTQTGALGAPGRILQP